METKHIIAATMIKGIGNAFIKKNLPIVKASTDLPDFLKRCNIKCEIGEDIEGYMRAAELIIQECEDKNYCVIDITSSKYPTLLIAISDAPAVLYLKGNVSLLSSVIAIIGTRHSTSLGDRIAERLGAHFSKRYAICNGLVEGIDKHAIYVGGKILPNIIGIISAGLNYNDTCSDVHAKIIDDVINAGGLIVSEFPPKQKEDQFSGSKASRIQAGLSQGLILVQSTIDGGSKYTVKAFSKLGRPLGVINFSTNEEFSSDSFSANRLIISKGDKGVAEFIGQKTVNNLKIKEVIPINSQSDYDRFEKAMRPYSDALW